MYCLYNWMQSQSVHISYNMYMYVHVHVHACSSKVAGGRVGSYDTHTSSTGNDLTRVCKTKSTEIICYAINCITYVVLIGRHTRSILVWETVDKCTNQNTLPDGIQVPSVFC